jgi:quercetin dioxygenase-like cupin family protein
MLSPTFTFADNIVSREQVFEEQQVLDKHVHSYSHLSIVLKGSFEVKVHNAALGITTTDRYKAGDVLVIPAYSIHSVQALESGSKWACIHADINHKEA